MREIKCISYKNKYDSLIKQYGKDEGSERYYKFIRSTSLETLIEKHGEVEGKNRYDEICKKHKGKFLQKLIIKHGEIEGKKIYENWLLNIKQTRFNFIKRYGEKEGNIKFDIYTNKRKLNLTNTHKEAKSYNTKLEYWLVICDGNLEESKKRLKIRQNTSNLKKYIEKYGKEKGELKYIETNRKKAITLDNFIRLYGEEDGALRYLKIKNNRTYTHSKQYQIDKYGLEEGEKKWKEISSKKGSSLENFIRIYGKEEGLKQYLISNKKRKYTNSIQYQIDKHGKEEGEKIWKERIIKRFQSTNFKSYSNIGLEFCTLLYEKIKNTYSNIFYGDNEYIFEYYKDGITVLRPDLYIRDLNLVIEYYGTYWHRDPLFYNDDNSKQIRLNDEKRIKILENYFKCDVIIVQEQEYLKDKNIVIEKVLNQIKKVENANH